MPSSTNYEFTDYQQSLDAAERRRKLSQALLMQGMQPTENQPAVGGVAIPNSPFSTLAKILEAYGGASGIKKSEEDTKTVSTKYNEDLAKALMGAQSAMSGTPSIQPDVQQVQQAADQGEPTPQASAPRPPDMNAAIQALMSHPATQGMGMTQLGQNMQRQGFTQSIGATNPMSPTSPAPSVMAGAPGTVQPQTMLGAGGPAGGIPMNIWLSSDPSGKSYIEQLAKDRAKINVRPGGTVYEPGQGALFTAPQGGMQTTWQNGQPQMGSVPGAIGALQATAEAGALGRSMGEFHPTQQASGATVPTLGRDITRAAQPTPQPSPRSTPSADPWANIPRLQTPSGVGQTTFQREYQAKQGENATKLGEKFGTQADMSNQRLAYNQQAAELVDKADTGPLALQSAQVKNWLVSNFKIPEEDFKNTPSATIALNKDLLNAAAEKAKQRYGSRMTQSEVMLQIKQGAPNVDMTKAAIKYLLDSDSAMAGYHIKQSEDYGRYIQSGGDPMRFEGWYARNFPMSKAVGQVKLEPVKPSGQPTVKELIEEAKRRGLAG